MNGFSRREFLGLAASLGASAAWARTPRASRASPTERRDLYPEGVASGDPDAHSVLLWTRRPTPDGRPIPLQVEVADDREFAQVIATARTEVSAEADWTCRVLVGNLQPAQIYWYRFIDADGQASRVGRTRTAPRDSDVRPVRFAFVACQNANLGEQHAYRRMIHDDECAPAEEQLGFIVHLGDFIYEIVCYPEVKAEVWGRRVRDLLRYPQGEQIGPWHIPTTLDDYRTVYRAYLRDPDLQDARARWPFVAIWDNHEFSAGGWQSQQMFKGQSFARQTRKVAANQAWFEYLPARIKKSSGDSLARFDAPRVVDTPIAQFDEHGLGQEPNNLQALQSLTGYRVFRWGRHVDLLITDQRSYRSEQPGSRPEAKPLWPKEFPNCIAQETLEALEAGRAYDAGHPPETLNAGGTALANFRKAEPPLTILGAEQKQWFLTRLKASTATWKIWGCTTGTLDRRVDLQNLPPGLTVPWTGESYATYEDGDHGSAWTERGEIYAWVKEQKIAGFATIAGDRHSFWAGLAAPSLPPKEFVPVGVAFVTASISTPNSAATLLGSVPPDHPLRALYFTTPDRQTEPEPVVNMLLRHGVRSCLEYAQSADLGKARQLSNPNLAPQLKFVDLDAYGFSMVHASNDALECEFVCISDPAEPVSAPDGGPIRYRVVHRSRLWKAGDTPALEQRVIAGNPELSL